MATLDGAACAILGLVLYAPIFISRLGKTYFNKCKSVTFTDLDSLVLNMHKKGWKLDGYPKKKTSQCLVRQDVFQNGYVVK